VVAVGHRLQHQRLHHGNRRQPGDLTFYCPGDPLKTPDMACLWQFSTFYCPGDPLKTPDMACLWQFSQNLPYDTEIGQVDEPEQGRGDLYRVTSYFWLMDTQTGRTNQPQGTGNKQWIKSLNCTQPASRELVLDAVLSTTGDLDTANFVDRGAGTSSSTAPITSRAEARRSAPTSALWTVTSNGGGSPKWRCARTLPITGGSANRRSRPRRRGRDTILPQGAKSDIVAEAKADRFGTMPGGAAQEQGPWPKPGTHADRRVLRRRSIIIGRHRPYHARNARKNRVTSHHCRCNRCIPVCGRGHRVAAGVFSGGWL